VHSSIIVQPNEFFDLLEKQPEKPTALRIADQAVKGRMAGAEMITELITPVIATDPREVARPASPQRATQIMSPAG